MKGEPQAGGGTKYWSKKKLKTDSESASRIPNNGHDDVFPNQSMMPHITAFTVMANDLRKEKISISDEAPMDERNAKKVTQHVKRQNTSW